MSDTRDHVHELVDRLPPAQLDAVARLLDAFLNSRGEEIGDEEQQAVDEAKRWLDEHGGRGIPHEEVSG